MNRYLPIAAIDRPGWWRLKEIATGQVLFGLYANANCAALIGTWLSGTPRPKLPEKKKR